MAWLQGHINSLPWCGAPVAVFPHALSLLRLPSQAGDILAAEDVQPEEIRRSSSAGSASQVSEGRVPVLRTLEAVPIMPSTVGCPLASHSLPSLPAATLSLRPRSPLPPILPCQQQQRPGTPASPRSDRRINAFELIKAGLDISALFEVGEGLRLLAAAHWLRMLQT